VAACAAASSGWRSGAINAAVPNATRSVTAAAAERVDNGSARVRASSESPTHTESNPAASAAMANSTSPRASYLPVIAVSRLGSIIPTRSADI
jgi:hypothetical protein